MKQQKETLSNVRNSAAGGLKLLDPAAVKERRLTFIAYDLEPTGDEVPSYFPATQSESLRKLKEWGFITSSPWRTCNTAKEVSLSVDLYTVLVRIVS